ncbi:hypothetical protein MRB53_037739 [Persea americana]|nr:hypothetical protein MRB53_037739 [Persea americana]
MALNPKFAGQRFVAATSAQPLHTLEFFLDYVCPYADRVQFIFRQQIQPWHPSSTLVHEAGVAVLQTAPDRFWPFSKALFDKQTEYFDENVVGEPRNKTYQRLAQLASSSVGLDEKQIYSLLEISDKPNSEGNLNVGNKVTNDIKLLVKGVPENSISSSFTKDDWEQWLKKNIV